MTSSRRSFVAKLWLTLGGVALVEYGWLIREFLRPRNAKAEDEMLIVAGEVEHFERGSVTAFPAGRFYLARLEDGGFMAFDRQCTHLGCTVPWHEEERQFVCPCHASSYDIRGQVLNPPAPRPLDLFMVRIENGIVKVDTRQPVRRRIFEPSQVAKA